MTDRDKVIKGIEQCTIDYCSKEFETQCEDCPYYTAGITLEECRKELRDDFHALLKELEPTVFKPHYIDKYGKHFICGVECGSCHKEISSTYHYCPYCGRQVKWE